MAVSMPLVAAASCGDSFTVYNQGVHTIETINTSPHGNPNWGPDLLGQYVLNAGYNDHPLSAYYGANCDCTEYQDVRAVYADGTVETDMDVDICENNVVFYY
jgi:hypothetical protein